MDAAEDRDVKLQRASADILLEFETLLPSYLWKSKNRGGSFYPGYKSDIRTWVKIKTTNRLIHLLEPFQEWPQLLDQHLNRFLQPLVSAFTMYLLDHIDQYFSYGRIESLNDIPLPRGICRILYLFCKVRGHKVITRFFTNAPKYLEPMLLAFQQWSVVTKSPGNSRSRSLAWEERYIMLLWISHLMLTPFKLASISSSASMTHAVAYPRSIKIPETAPQIVEGIVTICANHLSSASKEREAVRVLLVRLALRPDMRDIGLLDSLINWSLQTLSDITELPASASTYSRIGILAFIAGVIKSADTLTITPYLISIFGTMKYITTATSPTTAQLVSFALARQSIIKIFQSLVVSALQLDPSTADPTSVISNVLEDIIDHFLAALADKDTPVRLAASKALSIIALKMEPSMAAELVEAVIGSLEENVLWLHRSTGRTSTNLEAFTSSKGDLRRNLSAVNALRWQGLVLTLSHLLFRRSPPPHQLPAILNALILALNFEQRSTLRSSVGSNVRDAACFGIWSLARRYTTDELLAIGAKDIRAAKFSGNESMLQILAIELVVAATLDSSGNIRRGASASLQELIGRHPNTVFEGIALVQIVDYHAVALRSRAMLEVAVHVSDLGSTYWDAVLDGLQDWRGTGSPDAESRRFAGIAIGKLSSLRGSTGVEQTLARICDCFSGLQDRQVEERNGSTLALAAVINEIQLLHNHRSHLRRENPSVSDAWDIVKVTGFLDQDVKSTAPHADLTAEAVCTLISSLAKASSRWADVTPSAVKNPSVSSLKQAVEVLSLSLAKVEVHAVSAAANAAKDLFVILPADMKQDLVHRWTAILTLDNRDRIRSMGKDVGYIAVSGAIFQQISEPETQISSAQGAILDALVGRAKGPSVIASKVAVIQSLSNGVIASGVMTVSILEALKACLCDYTMDERGDVGSLIRLEAVDAIRVAWAHQVLPKGGQTHQLVALICGLAVSKLDKVRFRAWTCLQGMWSVFGLDMKPKSQFIDVAQTSTVPYFRQMIFLCHIDWLRTPLLEVYVTAAGAGHESLLQSSREALFDYCDSLRVDDLLVFCESLLQVLSENLKLDRVAIPSVEVLAFLFDVGILQILESSVFQWSRLFTVVHKFHYKSSNVHRLQQAIKVYCGMTSVKATKHEALGKLATMLLHPYPKIRNAAADALYIVVPDDDLEHLDWSSSPKELKDCVTRVRGRMRNLT